MHCLALGARGANGLVDGVGVAAQVDGDFLGAGAQEDALAGSGCQQLHGVAGFGCGHGLGQGLELLVADGGCGHQGGYGLLGYQDLAAEVAVLALGQAGGLEGGLDGGVDDLDVALGGDGFLGYQDLAAVGAVGAGGQAGLGAGGFHGLVGHNGVGLDREAAAFCVGAEALGAEVGALALGLAVRGVEACEGAAGHVHGGAGVVLQVQGPRGGRGGEGAALDVDGGPGGRVDHVELLGAGPAGGGELAALDGDGGGALGPDGHGVALGGAAVLAFHGGDGALALDGDVGAARHLDHAVAAGAGDGMAVQVDGQLLAGDGDCGSVALALDVGHQGDDGAGGRRGDRRGDGGELLVADGGRVGHGGEHVGAVGLGHPLAIRGGAQGVGSCSNGRNFGLAALGVDVGANRQSVFRSNRTTGDVHNGGTSVGAASVFSNDGVTGGVAAAGNGGKCSSFAHCL